jgi:chromosome segregation ATPase
MEHLLKGATGRKAALISQLKNSEERAEQLKGDMTLKKTLIRGKEEELTTLTRSIQEMNATILKMKDARDKKDIEVKEKGRAKKALEQQLEDLTESAHSSRQRSNFEKQINQLEADIDMLVMDGVLKTKLVKTKSAEMSAAEQNVRDVNSERGVLKHEMVELEQKVEHEKRVSLNITEELRSVDGDIAKLETQKKKTDTHAGGQVYKMKDLTANLQKSKQRKEQLQRSVEDLKRQLRDLSDRKAAVQAKVATRQKEADFFAEKEVEQTEIEEAASEKVSASSDSLKKAELDLRKIHEAISRKQMKLKVKDDEKVKLSSRIQSANKEKDRLIAVKTEKQSTLDRLLAQKESVTEPDIKKQIFDPNSIEEVGSKDVVLESSSANDDSEDD